MKEMRVCFRKHMHAGIRKRTGPQDVTNLPTKKKKPCNIYTLNWLHLRPNQSSHQSPLAVSLECAAGSKRGPDTAETSNHVSLQR